MGFVTIVTLRPYSVNRWLYEAESTVIYTFVSLLLILFILGELADSTRKNIICFAENNELFSFLYKHSLSFSASQLELVGFIDYDIEAQMRKSWTKYVSHLTYYCINQLILFVIFIRKKVLTSTYIHKTCTSFGLY